MTERDFFKTISEGTLTDEAIEYAKKKYAPMKEAADKSAAEYREIIEAIKGYFDLNPNAHVTQTDLGAAIKVSPQKVGYALRTFCLDFLDRAREGKTGTYAYFLAPDTEPEEDELLFVGEEGEEGEDTVTE